VHDRIDLPAMLLEQFVDRRRVADVDTAMFVTADICDQVIARLLRGSFRAKKLRAHIVVDSNDAHAVLGKPLDRFRSDQSG